MNNPYSLSLLGATIVGLLLSLAGMAYGSFWYKVLSLVCFVFFGLMIYHGFKAPELDEKSSVRKIWLLTLFGKQLNAMVESITFLCEWMPLEVLGHVEVEIKVENKNFKLAKPILCKKANGQQGTLVNDGYVEGEVSSAFVPDDSSAEALWKYVNAGRMTDVLNIIEGAITPGVEHTGSTHSNDWMETHSEDVGKLLRQRIKGLQGNGDHLPVEDDDDTNDIRGLGVVIVKLFPILKANTEVIKDRNDKLREEAQRVSQLEDTKTMNERVLLRAKLLAGNDNPSEEYRQEARLQIFDEQTLKDGKYTTVNNRNGMNVAQVPPVI